MRRDQSRKNRGSVVFGIGIAGIVFLTTTSFQRPSRWQLPPGISLPDAEQVVGGVLGFVTPKVASAKDRKAEDQRRLPVKRVAQEKANWCWAACAQMIHAQNGRQYTQTELARHVHGEDEEQGPAGRAAAYRELLFALSPRFTPDLRTQVRRAVEAGALSGGDVQVELDPLALLVSRFGQHTVNSDDLVAALLARSPVLVVLDEGPEAGLDHAYVVRGAGWARSQGGVVMEGLKIGRGIFGEKRSRQIPKQLDEVVLKYALVWVDLIDPDAAAVEEPRATRGDEPPPPPAFLRLSGEDFKERVRLILTPQKAEEILKAQYDVLRIQPSSRRGGAR